MPPRKTLLAKSLSNGKLPILPFLAPRIFEPWPKGLRLRRAHGTASTRSGHGSESMNLPDPIITHRSKFPITKPQLAGRPHYAEMGEAWSIGDSDMRTSTDYGRIYNDEACFRKAYEDIWGPERTKKRFKEEPYAPLDGLKDVVSTKRVGIAQSSQHAEPRTRTMAKPRMTSISNQRVPQVRTKYIRLPTRQNVSHIPLQGSGLDQISFLWTHYFSILSRKYDSHLYRYAAPRYFRVQGVLESTQFFERELSLASLSEVQKAWEALPETQRDLIWVPVMLGALGSRPSWALKFLIASTSSKSCPPSYAISDSIQYIVCFFLYQVKKADARSVTVLFRTAMWLLDKFNRDYLHLSQKTIFWLLAHINVGQAEQLYNTLVKSNHPLHENTLLQFADKFSREGQTQLGIHSIQKFHSKGGDFAQPKVESVCATLLQRRYRNISDRVTSDSDIFGLLLGLGLRPNIIFYNILLQNAIESGDSETAWKIHDMMPGLGIEADTHTYSILLNAAKLRMDRPTMERIVEIVESKGITNEFIITDLLHAMFLTFEHEKRATAYWHGPPPAPLKRMLPIYAKYFNLEPLNILLTRAYIDLVVPSNQPKMHPSKATLVVMFIALLRGFTNVTSTTEWYIRFRTLVLSGHPDIAPLAESTHIYDAVIMSLGRWPATLHLCTAVISDMFSSYSASQEALNQLHPPVRNRETLQTTMGSYSPPVSTTPLGAHEHHRIGADNKVNEELAGELQESSVAKFGESVHCIDEDPLRQPGESTSSDSSLTASEIVVDEPSSDKAKIHEHCKPSVRTWSILLKAFMDNNQPRAAEKVLTMMQYRGIKPNMFTWNSLAVGYARLQDVSNTVDVIDRFENEGWEVDKITATGLQAIKNRRALKEALGQRDLKRLKKQELLQKAAATELDASWSGGLSAVLEKEEVFKEATDTPEKGRPRRGHRQSRPVRLDDHELRFLDKPHSPTNLGDHNHIMKP